jgi:hypothetical protein
MAEPMVTLTIDGKAVTVPRGTLITEMEVASSGLQSLDSKIRPGNWGKVKSG